MRVSLALLCATATATAAAPPQTCTDGGSPGGAVIAGDEIRFCLDQQDPDRTCWSFSITAQTVRPIAVAGALDARPGEISVGAVTEQDGTVILPPEQRPPPSPWHLRVDDEGATSLCGPKGCRSFKAPAGVRPEELAAAAVSPSGKLVAVQLGEGISAADRMYVGLYDPSGRRLAVARPNSECLVFEGFAGETLVVQEYGCGTYGGARLLVTTAGVIARIAGEYSWPASFVQVAGDVWAFGGDGQVNLYDVVRGKRLGHARRDGIARLVSTGGKVYSFETLGVVVADRTLKTVAAGAPPSCLWHWENESIGPLRLRLDASELPRLLGAPRTKTRPELAHGFRSRWTYASGVTLGIEPSGVGDFTEKPVPPYRVSSIDVAAPSKLRLAGRVGIGSTRADIDAAYGAHVLTARSTNQTVVLGNPEYSGGITLDLVDDKVTAIHLQ